MTDITLSRVTDWTTLGIRWRELEARSDCSFFQSWTWVGCLAAERFDDPVLLEASVDGRLVAMGLFNRRLRSGREALLLSETGHTVHDAVFIEWNGLLAATGTPVQLLADCLRSSRVLPLTGRRPWLRRRITLSGIGAPALAAAQLAEPKLFVRRSMGAPFVDLAGLKHANRQYLDVLSANTRYQVRRSNRTYGELTLRRATTLDEAFEFLEQLAALHQATWRRRGRPGAFAEPLFGKFHRTLIERGLARGEIALLSFAARSGPVGFLYNFEWKRQVSAYQSGFDYPEAGPHQKPGLTCHQQAIEDAAARGLVRYDFLAGADRYKRSLATSEEKLHWVELGKSGMKQRLAGWLRARMARVRARQNAKTIASDTRSP
jgi:CelD/BcsL family acetyltransferase involved in cellulose biosynthesis